MKKKLKEFIMKKKVAAGCVAAAAVITAGSFGMLWQPSDVPELTDYTDPVIETTITGDDTPLAAKPKVTTKTTKSTKTSKKTVTLKKASKKTYTKKLPTQTKKSTSTTKKNSTTTVKTEKTVKTETTEKYTKKSKKKVVTKKVTTTVKTTTTVVQQIASASSEDTSGAGTSNSSATANKTETANKGKYTISNVASIAPKMDSRVLNAYTKMGFSVIVDPSVSYAGYFSAKNRTITLQEADNTIYHELGHFLAFIAGNVDQGSEFLSIYNSEKSSYAGANKAYATQNSSEFFAECVRDYINNPSLLESKCPKTYATIEKSLDKITDSRINMIMKVYASVWK